MEPSGNLPAPYVSPWQEFGRNLQAMAADVRLRGQELLRRNLEGELSVPGFWPRDLAPTTCSHERATIDFFPKRHLLNRPRLYAN